MGNEARMMQMTDLVLESLDACPAVHDERVVRGDYGDHVDAARLEVGVVREVRRDVLRVAGRLAAGRRVEERKGGVGVMGMGSGWRGEPGVCRVDICVCSVGICALGRMDSKISRYAEAVAAFVCGWKTKIRRGVR